MKKLLSLITLLLCVCSGAWGQDFTYALSSFTVDETTYTYEFSSENGLKNKTAWVEVPSSTSEGIITFKGSSNKNDRYLYIYGTNGTVKDETRKIVMNTSWPTAIAFSSSDIKTSGEKFYLVFSTSDDFKTKGVKYTLTDPSGLEITPASGFYAGKASVTMSANEGYTIYYTDNGTTPTKSSTVYTGPFDVTSNKTIKAIAYKGEDYGFVQTAEYTIVSENRTYDFTALTAADLLALQENTGAFQDDTSNKYISNKEAWANGTDHAFEGGDGTDISVAQYLLFGRSGSGTSAGNVRYYYGDNKYIYFNNSSCYVKIPAVKAGQKVVLEMSASSDATISGTNTTESSKNYASSSKKTKLTFFASADGTVTLTSNKAFYIYSIEVKTPVYYHVTYDLNGGTGTTPTETDKEEGDKFNLHDGTTGITAPTGKEFSKWVDQDSNELDGGAEYTMPAKKVTLTAKWIDEVVKYDVTKGTHANGDFSIDKTNVAAGETVTLTATPDFRYLFDSWNVYKTGDPETKVTVTSNQFTMPAYAVTVDASFVADSRKQILYLTTTAKETTEANDKLYAALNSVDDYNVIIEAPASQTLDNYDLIVLHESIGGTSEATAVTGCKTTTTPVLNTKSYFYGADGDASKRWQWGAPNAGKSVKGATLNTAFSNIASHPIFAGVTISTNFFEITDEAAEKCMQPVGSFVAGKEGFTLATTPNKSTGDGAAIHELTPAQRGATSGKYLLISVSSAKLNDLNANGQKLFKNAAAYLISDDQWIPTVPVTVTSAEWATATTPNWPVEFDENAKVYVVASAEGSIQLTQIYDAPANTPIIVNAAAGSYTMTPKASAAAIETNLLRSKTANNETAKEGDYALGYYSDGVTIGFGKLDATGVAKMTDDKAFIPASLLANAVDFLPFVIGDEENETTSINSIENGELRIENSDYIYNLAGQKVSKDYKGIVIVNGKKVIRK